MEYAVHGWYHHWWENSGDEMYGGRDGGFIHPWISLLSMDGGYP